jgi:hypothetical protein
VAKPKHVKRWEAIERATATFNRLRGQSRKARYGGEEGQYPTLDSYLDRFRSKEEREAEYFRREAAGGGQ